MSFSIETQPPRRPGHPIVPMPARQGGPLRRLLFSLRAYLLTRALMRSLRQRPIRSASHLSDRLRADIGLPPHPPSPLGDWRLPP